MGKNSGGGGKMVNMEQHLQHKQIRQKFGALLSSDHPNYNDNDNDNVSPPIDNRYPSPRTTSYAESPYLMSPWSQASPFAKSPWLTASPAAIMPYSPFPGDNSLGRNGLIGSLVREEGHVYSLAVSGELLYTGSDSKNIRVWRNLREFTGFKCSSGLVKAIVISGDRIFTGHQDGKIRVWRVSRKNAKLHHRVGSLPTFKDALKSSLNPSNYVEVRRRRNVLRIRHYDAVSSMSLDEEHGVLYSASWDKTVKVWRTDDSKCLESFVAHDDAVNAVVSGPDSLVFTGSADGTVKAWRRQVSGDGYSAEHFLLQTLLRQENAVTALAVSGENGVVYAGSSDGLLNFWDLRGKWLSHGGVLKGHRLAVLCLATEGSLVFSGSADKNICVWKRVGEAHVCLSVLTGHIGPVKCLTVEEDRGGGGENETDDVDEDRSWVVYSGSLDKSVKVWRVSENAPELKQLREWEQQLAGSDVAPSPKRSPLDVRRLNLSQRNLLAK